MHRSPYVVVRYAGPTTANAGGDEVVGTVLACNVLSGLIDAAYETVLTPVFIVPKGSLGPVECAAAARENNATVLAHRVLRC